ncbi:rho GTPase activating protein 22 [Roridomyces roridus]|uniref:Rho GTPase activating protein 22 n=1 Tax=Roridomyces roridus TaxID=1738132 RepID=A0AAD7C8U6_9AGAR|nr:rho GTPase activating protein 22 [Roridomyces roridus]
MVWPVIGGEKESKERERDGGGSPVSISISAPVLADGAVNGTGGQHVHTRSHSFTPKLPSRLATGSSPGRKGSAGEIEHGLMAEGKERRGGFANFHFGGASAQAKHDPSPLLAPPIILAPAPVSASSSTSAPSTTESPAALQPIHPPEGKRASQIVYAAGFVNRFAAPAYGLGDPRAWKPAKMEVRGTKLVLHKVPGDRAVGVRDLFPASAVGFEEDEAEPVERERERDVPTGRKRRAYWGRARHPALIVDLGSGEAKVERGSLEALLHETVFATVYPQEEGWQAYARAVLLCLPLIAPRERVEAELARCAGYLLSGAEEGEESDRAKARVVWMKGEYTRMHGPWVDSAVWEGVSVEAEEEAKVLPGKGGMPTSSSTQAMYTPSPMIGAGSPALGADLTHPPPSSPRPQPPLPGLATRLEAEGLSRDLLHSLDPHLIAHSLTIFHRAVLAEAPGDLTVDFLLGDVRACEQLFGSDASPNWLTRLVLGQVLGSDGSGEASGTSRTHSRSEVISIWVRVGEICRVEGDNLSFGAISAALCSAPIARLEKVWRRVEAAARVAVEGWARLLAEGEGPSGEGRLTLWGGDVRERLRVEVDAARGVEVDGTEQTFHVGPMERARDVFEDFRREFLLCPRRGSILEDEGEDVKLLVGFWRARCVEGAGGAFAAFVRVDQFMALSLASEPRRKGLFEPHYWTRAGSAAPYSSLLPLLFPEVLPSTALVDRAQLLRGRVDSDGEARVRRLEPTQQQLPRTGLLAGLEQMGNGTIIPVANGEGLLSVWQGTGDSTASSRPSSRIPSRPPSSVVGDSFSVEGSISRAPSVRVKTGSSAGLDRKTSLARRSSLPSPAQRRAFIAAEPSSEPPLRVRVVAGTLNWLVDILAHGLQGVSVSITDDNGEMSLREGRTRELVIDKTEFTKLWWNVFRSLVTPMVFFELLRKMYLQTRPRGAVPSVAEFLYVAGSRTEVLDTIETWIIRGGGAQDMLDDSQLFSAVRAFLKDSIDHAIPSSPNASDPSVEQAWSTLAEVRARLRRTFESQTMRPPAPFTTLTPPAASASGQRPKNQSREPPDIDRIDPEELVDNLDAMAYAAFSNVTEEDLFVTSDLLEVQTADRIGWFLPFAPSEESVEVQNMYSYLQEIEPSPLISESQDSLYRLLPPGIRSCIRAYVILRKWTIAQLVAPRLGLRARQSRMELILRAIEVTRLRNMSRTKPPSIVDDPCARSFVEAVLTSAVISVESRMHHRPWQNIAGTRGAQCDSLVSLLSVHSTQSVVSRELTLDVGWFLERLLEVIAAPDVIESPGAQPEAHNLINFDKRRHLCHLILGVHKGSHREDNTRRAFERLNNIEKGVWQLQFDHRSIKDEAQREGASGPGSSPAATRRTVRPFQRIVTAQIEKNRRDRTIRSRLHKERVQEQTKNEKREDLMNKAMRKPATPQQQKHQRGKKSMSSAFMQFMRPISSAFGNEILHSPGVKRTAEELDFVPTGKPTLTVSLVEARIMQFINNDRAFVFQLDTEDGGHYILQAVNKREMTRWLDTINRVTQTTARRRLTYLGPKPQLADHLHDGTMATSRDPSAVFGVDLNVLLRREVGSDDIPAGTLPSIIERCLSEIEDRGLMEVGIYRLAGATSVINALKEAFNRGEDPLDTTTDIHAVCDLIKSWFRVLPEPLFPSADYHAVIETSHIENLEERLAAIRTVVYGLPRPNFDLLKRVAEHLDRVADFEEYNQMTVEGLAIVFSPNLLRAPQENFAMILANMGHTHKLVKAMITHFHVIFGETEVDAEGEGEEGEEEGEEVAEDGEDEPPFHMDDPTPLEDVAEDDEEFVVDLPPVITAPLDHSPLEFTFNLTP